MYISNKLLRTLKATWIKQCTVNKPFFLIDDYFTLQFTSDKLFAAINFHVRNILYIYKYERYLRISLQGEIFVMTKFSLTSQQFLTCK